ncbi:UNVERIFIED_CONTAM: hypothetical protein Sangu_0478400 [Sesamum angustifolium]|uniref:Integrase catalytic domain-containing protein n=1 Tax=Sesamum angustifolium TaxID=2727405 RepID=A0AAW2Q7S9_9LAMI
MLVQYEATIKKSAPLVLIGQASTSKAKDKRARHWKRKKGKAKAKTVVVAKDAKSAPVTPVGMGKGKRRMGMCVIEVNMVTNSASWVLDTGCGAHIYNDLQVLQRSRKLSKGEVVLRSDWMMTAQNKRKIDNFENAQIWHARLGHISQDRMKRLVDSKSLDIDNLDNLPTYICGPLDTQARGAGRKDQARGGFSYFITFTNDHSWYGYVYLMSYKSEAFVRFKEFRLEVENQTGRKIEILRSDRSGEYLSGEFIDYLKEKGIVSQWTPHGMPQLNSVAERRNRTLLDMIRSMMRFTELPLSIWGYALEMAARLLNIVPSKTVAQTLYQIWHGKPIFYKYLRVWGSPTYVKRLVGDKLD